MSKEPVSEFTALIQRFFTQYLVDQRALSPCTIKAYRDSFLLLIRYAEQVLGKIPTDLTIGDLSPELIAGFLDELEKKRGNTVRTRNARLAAIRSFMQFVSRTEITHLANANKVLCVPMKRFEKPLLTFLTRKQISALLDTLGGTWIDERDRLFLQLLYNTGARVSEILSLTVDQVIVDHSACVHLIGKGRKSRTVPLWSTTLNQVRQWLKCNPELKPCSPLFPTRQGQFMTRANASSRLAQIVKRASVTHPELADKHITPHTIRHTTAMHLLQSGVDLSVIALWLGHESPSTTHLYIEADLTMKEKALATVNSPEFKPVRYCPPNQLLGFLQGL